MYEKKHVFGSYKNASFPKPDFIPQGSFHKKGNPQRGIAPLISDPRIAPQKKTFHVIPQSVHSMSFRKGNAKKNRALKYYFLQSWVCSMGWSGERERGVATSHFQSHNDTISAKKTIFSDREKLFCSQGPISSHSTKREIHKRDLHLHFRSQNCRAKNIPFYPTKRSFHIIPQRECGETILQSLKNVVFLQSQVC